jgi:predicted RNA methylase
MTYGKLPVHRWMLRDGVRNEAYRQALTHLVKPGAVVLDMGAGTGILSIFAVNAGAKKVYAVERSAIANVAKRMIERNGHADKITVIESDLEDVTLPERVDVLVSEWMGGFGVDENMLAPLVMARDRHLVPGGKIIPGRVTALLAPASLTDLDEHLAHWRSRPHGVDMTVIAENTANETFQSQTVLEPVDLLATPQPMWSHDPYVCSLAEADQPFIANLTFTANRAGMLSGFVAWFTAEMGDGKDLTNDPSAPDTHWGRTVFPLDRAREVAAGDPIHVELHCDPSTPGSCEYSWVATIGAHVERHDTRPTRQR